METTLMQFQSLCIVLLMLVGIAFKRKRTAHIRIMSVAMIWDIILILQIELSRSAILKASQAVSNPLALNVHVSIAVATVVLYAFMVYTGRGLLNGKVELRQKHRVLGYSTLLMRILTFVTSFWAVAPKV
jgi:Na+/H+ antiporter NhaD/arsenite permease-like protein